MLRTFGTLICVLGFHVFEQLPVVLVSALLANVALDAVVGAQGHVVRVQPHVDQEMQGRPEHVLAKAARERLHLGVVGEQVRDFRFQRAQRFFAHRAVVAGRVEEFFRY